MEWLWLSGFCAGAGLALGIRGALDWYVDRYKRQHHQPPYDRRTF